MLRPRDPSNDLILPSEKKNGQSNVRRKVPIHIFLRRFCTTIAGLLLVDCVPSHNHLHKNPSAIALGDNVWHVSIGDGPPYWWIPIESQCHDKHSSGKRTSHKHLHVLQVTAKRNLRVFSNRYMRLLLLDQNLNITNNQEGCKHKCSHQPQPSQDPQWLKFYKYISLRNPVILKPTRSIEKWTLRDKFSGPYDVYWE